MVVANDPLAMLLLKQDVEAFLYHEANLLDDRRYEEWLDLLTDDVRYWVPMRRNVKFGELEREFTREGQDINWFDEGKTTLTQRVRQILTGVHWAEEPLSRHLSPRHQRRDTEATPTPAEAEEVSLRCRFIIYRNRVETETDILVGRREDRLLRRGRRLEHRPAAGVPRPERPPREKSDLLLLTTG